MGLFEYLFGSSYVSCDICGDRIDGEPIVYQHRDYCAACNKARLDAVEAQRIAEEEAYQRIFERERSEQH